MDMEDIRYMKRAITLSKKGIGKVNPNPLVGAVIVKGGRIIAEGYHHFYGGDHAEVDAFKHAGEDVSGAVMYVTLEPCSHFGKTPPCAKAIVERKLSKVVVGMADPNPLVSGKGIQMLKDGGVEVVVGVLEEKIRRLNEIFIKYITTKTPFCLMKTAMTLDGKIATYCGDSKWITNEESRGMVHKLRHQYSAVLVGIGTVIADDPRLTARLKNQKGANPHRIIVDTYAKIPLKAKVISVNPGSKTIIATTQRADQSKLEALKEKGAEIILTPLKNNRVDLPFLFEELGKMGIDSVLAEGGGDMNESILFEGLADKVMAFIAPKIIGGRGAKAPVGGKGVGFVKDAVILDDIKAFKLGTDVVIEGYVRKES